LVGVDTSSIYCYLLAEAEHRDEDTWGIRLLDAKSLGFDPDYTIADAGAGLRAGSGQPWETPRVMAMCSTFSTNAKRWPIFWAVWRKELPPGGNGLNNA